MIESEIRVPGNYRMVPEMSRIWDSRGTTRRVPCMQISDSIRQRSPADVPRDVAMGPDEWTRMAALAKHTGVL